DEVDAGRGLEGADVAALTPDDATLHVLARDGEHTHGRFGGLLRRHTLDRDRHDLAGALIPVLSGPLLDLTYLPHGRALGLLDHLPHEVLPGLGGRHRRDLLELSAMHLGRLLELLANVGELLLTLCQLGGTGLDLRALRPQIF